jgi:hypothetical protein
VKSPETLAQPLLRLPQKHRSHMHVSRVQVGPPCISKRWLCQHCRYLDNTRLTTGTCINCMLREQSKPLQYNSSM